jgi:toxin ParE1/3/4
MMLVISSAAETELREAILHYRAQYPELGARFFSEYQRALDHIRNFPNACPRASKRARKCRVKGFP